METLSKNAKIYMPENDDKINGVIQIIHGMAEHQKRYTELADFLTKSGIVVITSDLRGHGDNIKREEDLGYFGDNAVTHLIADIHDITMYVKSNFPHKPYFILGHSMGTLIATSYFKRYDNFIDGLFLSGMPGNNNMTAIAKLAVRITASFKGEFYRSVFINKIMNGPFVKPFKSEGSDFAWLATDQTVVRMYENDPKCGYIFTLNGFYTLLELMEETYKNSPWIMKNKDCPVLLMSGADDPCMGNKKNFLRSVEMFKKAGYKNVSHILYSGNRHEIFNDKDKEKAMSDLLDAINDIALTGEPEIELNLDMFKSS